MITESFKTFYLHTKYAVLIHSSKFHSVNELPQRRIMTNILIIHFPKSLFITFAFYFKSIRAKCLITFNDDSQF